MDELRTCARCHRSGRERLYLSRIDEKDLEGCKLLRPYLNEELCFLCRLELRRKEADIALRCCEHCVYFSRVKEVLACAIDGSFTVPHQRACGKFKSRNG